MLTHEENELVTRTGAGTPMGKVRFHQRMKVEGVTHARISGRGAMVFVDDAGGYQVLWDDDPRLK